MTVEVRCCCDPGRLLGWIVLKERALYPGFRQTFAIPTYSGLDWSTTLEAPIPIQTETISLEVAELWDPLSRGPRLAFKSNDAPIAQLRRIPAFREAPAQARFW